jgi:hypothetical protein
VRISIHLAVAALIIALLAGCASGGNGPAAVESATPRAADIAERACLRDVAREANDRDVMVLSSTPSPEGTEVIIGVGPQRTRWRCIGYGDGTTTVVIALAEERLL